MCEWDELLADHGDEVRTAIERAAGRLEERFLRELAREFAQQWARSWAGVPNPPAASTCFAHRRWVQLGELPCD